MNRPQGERSMRTRRAFLLGGAGLGALLIGAASYETWRLYGRHYPPTPYDDLLDLLPDRNAAKLLGEQIRDTGSIPIDSHKLAAELRSEVARLPLSRLADEDTREGRVAELGGWVLPFSVIEICWLAKNYA